MPQPIYKLYRAKFTDAWYQLAPEERDRLLARMREVRDELGIKRVMSCNCRWSSEEWDMFGIEAFADIEAVQQYAKALGDIDWFRYVEGESMLGTDWYSS